MATLQVLPQDIKKGDRIAMTHSGRVRTAKRVQAYTDTVVVWWAEGNHTVYTHGRIYGVKPVTVDRA